MTPWILNQVASVADAVDDIAFGTAKGPMRLGLPFFSVVSAASTMVRVEGPPEPMIGLPMKWQAKNHRSGLMSNSARMKPLSKAPPVSLISVIRSNISIGG